MNFEAIHREAYEAGMKAGNGASPVPMVVGSPSTPLGNDVDRKKEHWFVADGVCGFAWVHFKGNTPWGRWAKKNKIASKDYPSGLMVWVREFGQSMQRKEAFAAAYAAVLRKYGIDAYSNSRMD